MLFFPVMQPTLLYAVATVLFAAVLALWWRDRHRRQWASGPSIAEQPERPLTRARAARPRLGEDEWSDAAERPAVGLGELDEVDLAELVSDLVGAPPFPDAPPRVELRVVDAAPLKARRARLINGLAALLWAARREGEADGSLVVTVSRTDDSALLEIDTRRAPTAISDEPPRPQRARGLALRIAERVAAAHHGHLRVLHPGRADCFVLVLPRRPSSSPSPPGPPTALSDEAPPTPGARR